MLSLLRISNIALIDQLEIEFGSGLNLLTGETGSGKSIIVDSLGALTGERVSADLVKEGFESATIEGLFALHAEPSILQMLRDAGIAPDTDSDIELIIRREISVSGRNRIYINGRLATASLLKQIGVYLVDIHGQGEHTSLTEAVTNLKLLDEFAQNEPLRESAAAAYSAWAKARSELAKLEHGESEKLQLIDVLRFQVEEISRLALKPGEAAELEEEKRRLNNTEKLSSLSSEALDLLYESDAATVTTLEKALRNVEELAEFDSRFAGYKEGLDAAQAVLQDLSFAVRDFATHLEFSPERLEVIEDRLAEITRVSRKYGGTVESALAHQSEAAAKLEAIENSELHQEEMRTLVAETANKYLDAATRLHLSREKAARSFAKEVRSALAAVALEKAKFEVAITAAEADESRWTPAGFDRVEFLFSANPGESVKPLAKVASGGESSRLMLILKTTARGGHADKTAVFDEVDAGIGGRVAEAVGSKLKELALTQQVLCVTHQPQVASQADSHFVVEKSLVKNRAVIAVRRLSESERIEEIARMLAGETITKAARDNARELIAAAG
jgi:DNA repair protein RecN (Recombination protein N)